ncbi:hypothetical protein BCR32DRAFT_292590 [Anaeromyces robustus]|uniref:Uncharacterized protein n=1 Tax=Anaeromyces robustus TaxID=1754192 RepID=A0A1Y1X9R7_9FUNG|nr:hypothetical protein BCR32DRAFT_292590 [Anaeromyces robustus]|eukprot:ORX82500.1 hypothetical protein BCR32DRAFT_292590 [Anaeromyces robustus]
MQSLEELRKTIIVSPTEDLQNRRKPHLPSDDNPNYTYGLETKYSTPVGKLISYHYQREWENMVIEGIYEKKKKEYEEKMKAMEQENGNKSESNNESSSQEGQKTEVEVNNSENEDSHKPKIIHKCHCHDEDVSNK